MAYTISTHNGHDAFRGHNRRDERIVSKEPHIDLNGEHKSWLDIEPREAYQRIFGKSIDEYNERQKEKGHSERQIKDYFQKICDDKKKHPVYEMITSIGSRENHPDAETSRKILYEFVKDWKKRNPNLIMIGAYYHNDEQTPHVHIDYIPVAKDMGRGPKLQNSLEKAFNQMGFKSESIKNTAQIAWEHRENQVLEDICKANGLEIIHPKREKVKHLDKELYIKTQELAEIDHKIDKAIDYHNELVDTIDELKTNSVELAYDVIEAHEQEVSIDDRYPELER